jgi:hypothetical protein
MGVSAVTCLIKQVQVLMVVLDSSNLKVRKAYGSGNHCDPHVILDWT